MIAKKPDHDTFLSDLRAARRRIRTAGGAGSPAARELAATIMRQHVASGVSLVAELIEDRTRAARAE